MNGLLRDLLSEHADAAGTPDLDLQDLITQGEQRVRRRRRVVLGSTAAAVVVTVGVSFALLQGGDRTTSPDIPPATDSPSTEVVPDPTGTDGEQPLTYGVGGTIHYGDRVIEAAEDADGLFLVDDGLVILTGGDGPGSETRLYLTDGVSEPVEFARGVAMVTGGDVGTPLVWLDGDDVVIYDTDVRSVIDRVPLNGMRLANPITSLEEAVYWTEYDDSTATELSDGQLVRYDLSTGARAPASGASYRAEAQPPSPDLVVGSAESTEPVEDFTVIDARLEVDTDGQGTPAPVFVAATGDRLRVKVPDHYEGATMAVFQWLNEDQFALVALGSVKRAPIGDLLECRISAGECHTVAPGEQFWLLPGHSSSVGSED